MPLLPNNTPLWSTSNHSNSPHLNRMTRSWSTITISKYDSNFFVEICLWTEGIPLDAGASGGMVPRAQGSKGKRWAAAVKFPVTAVFPRRPSSPPWSHTEVRTIPPKPLGKVESPTRQCAHFPALAPFYLPLHLWRGAAAGGTCFLEHLPCPQLL